MFGWIEIAAALWFGRGVVRYAGIPLTRLERHALVGAAALTLAPWVWFLCAWAFGFRFGLPIACVALAGAGHLLARARPPVHTVPTVGTSRLSWAALALLLGIAFHGHMLHDETGGVFSGGSSYGDLALHATLANHFAVTDIDFASPLVANQPLTYPFLCDFAAACLMRGGWAIPTAFSVMGWLGAMVAFALVQAFVLRVWKRRSAATIAVWTIVLSGSCAGIWYAAHDFATHGIPSDLGSLPSYAHDRARGLVWANFVADFLLPQRAFVAALPAAWAAIWAMRAAFDDREHRALAVAAGAIGALPFFHVHSFLVCIGLLAWCAAWRTAIERRAAARWWLALGAAALIAAPQLAWQFGHSWGHGFGHWNLGWLAPRGGLWWFWLRNLGVVLLLVPVTLWVAWRGGRNRFASALVPAALIVFVAGNLYQFQPHDWDNMKFFLYAFMFIIVVAAGAIASWLSLGRAGQVIATLTVLTLTLSGALTLARELYKHDQLASAGDRKLAGELDRVLPGDARVLTSDQHNHVVPMLTGRAIVMGYRGWLWTYGIDSRRLARDVAAMFGGTARGERLLRRYGVTHIYVGPGERKTFYADVEALRARYPRVLQYQDVEVFDVRPVASVLAAAGARR